MLSLQPFPHFSIDFGRFSKGIDNVHIDVCLSTRFTVASEQLIARLLDERTSTHRRTTDPPSKKIREQLDAFNTSYASMLTAAIYRAKEGKKIDSIQLFEIAVLKFVLTTLRAKMEQLVYELKKESAAGKQTLDAYERIVWIGQNRNHILYRVASEILNQIYKVEAHTVKNLRESLLGIAWSVPEEVLFNPLLQVAEVNDHEVLMTHYILLSQDSDNRYGISRLSILLDRLFDGIVAICQQVEAPSVAANPVYRALKNISFSWKDVPTNIEELLDTQNTLHSLQDVHPNEPEHLKRRLLCQRKANIMIEQSLRQAGVMENILAAYETPRLYAHYAKLIKPYLLYQALCGEIDIREVEFELDKQSRTRPLRRTGDKPLHISELVNAKKTLRKLARKEASDKVATFVKNFVTYRRDLKYYQIIYDAMEQIHLLFTENDIQLSRSNNMLYEFLEENECGDTGDVIRNHTILKADLRGSTTITAELQRRGLNPATHFSRNFFDPIRELIAQFGAEKVFIEGDAIILCLSEVHSTPDQWFAVARACGLAQSMLAVVESKNQESLENQLPPLELGIGICHLSGPPTFLYDGDHRIMISSAIGDADRLSSCSWKLRRKYAQKSDLLTHVMVFRQPPTDKFQGEKGMTTFRYNLNGVELGTAAFEKLKGEISLRCIKTRLPGEEFDTAFYSGQYPDAKGEIHEIVIRQGVVRLWQDNISYYPPTDTFYYEVVVNKRLLGAIKRLIK